LQVDLEQHDWFYEFPLASTNVYVRLVIHITSDRKLTPPHLTSYHPSVHPHPLLR
jgi:hypothetical protein